MATERKSIKFVNAVLSTLEREGQTTTVLQGSLDRTSVGDLLYDKYQRLVVPGPKQKELIMSVRAGTVPPITLGVRGSALRDGGNGTFYVPESVFTIDGRQRNASFMKLEELEPGASPLLRVLVYFNTTYTWERRLFLQLNLNGLRLAANVVARDLADDYLIIEDLLHLTRSNMVFPLWERVCWEQRFRKGELINARTFLQTCGLVHANFGPTRSSDTEAIVAGNQAVAEAIGSKQFLANVEAFWNLVEGCWGVKNIEYRQSATQLKGGFLSVLARLLQSCPEFWVSPTKKAEAAGLRSQLVIGKNRRDRLRTFPLQDPTVVAMAGGNVGKMGNTPFYVMLLDHMNHGLRAANKLIDPTLGGASMQPQAKTAANAAPPAEAPPKS